ncbi:MAG TPA: kelch repeat-containing protein, partial [Verrucomicrobiae bacterium]|nr:kelch repeat-containing protein [Verrucomicrobiae bacterium]
GYGGAGYLDSAELYDPAAAGWAVTASMNSPRFGHTATLLPDGQVLAAGGFSGTAILSSVELYTPS